MTEAQNKGALTLAEYPGEIVRLACDRCGRQGQYRRATLARVFKETTTLPDILAAMAYCPNARNASDPCGAHYPDLSEERRRM
jgi:hypothetical protein